MTSAPVLPNYLGLPFRILVSPFVHFDPETRLTDILMFNSKNLGALIVAEEAHVKSWEDGQYNILNMSIEETYGLGILQEGQACVVAKNGTVRPNEFIRPARPVFNLVSSSFRTTKLSRVTRGRRRRRTAAFPGAGSRPAATGKHLLTD
jgi:hypothetical protein